MVNNAKPLGKTNDSASPLCFIPIYNSKLAFQVSKSAQSSTRPETEMIYKIVKKASKCKNLQLYATYCPEQEPLFTDKLVHFNSCLAENKETVKQKNHISQGEKMKTRSPWKTSTCCCFTYAYSRT